MLGGTQPKVPRQRLASSRLWHQVCVCMSTHENMSLKNNPPPSHNFVRFHGWEPWVNIYLVGAESNGKNRRVSKSHRHGDKATLSKLSPVAFSHYRRGVFQRSRSTKLRSLELSAPPSSAIEDTMDARLFLMLLLGKTLPAAAGAAAPAPARAQQRHSRIAHITPSSWGSIITHLGSVPESRK